MTKIIIRDAKNEKNLIFLKSFNIKITKTAAKVLKKNATLSPLKKIKTSIKMKTNEIKKI